MGRSVSTPCHATAVAYAEEPEGIEDHLDFRDFIIEPFQDAIKAAFPSSYKIDYLIGREDHAIMENAHAYFGLSEYCGLLAYWIVPKSDSCIEYPELAESWCEQVADKFRGVVSQVTGGETLHRLGTFSNGESVYARG